jgi:hypothetical protein
MSFHDRGLEVTRSSRLLWTNEAAITNGRFTTLTFEESLRQTLPVVHDLPPSKEALDEDLASGGISSNDETFNQLDGLFSTPGASLGLR